MSGGGPSGAMSGPGVGAGGGGGGGSGGSATPAAALGASAVVGKTGHCSQVCHSGWTLVLQLRIVAHHSSGGCSGCDINVL